MTQRLRSGPVMMGPCGACLAAGASRSGPGARRSRLWRLAHAEPGADSTGAVAAPPGVLTCGENTGAVAAPPEVLTCGEVTARVPRPGTEPHHTLPRRLNGHHGGRGARSSRGVGGPGVESRRLVRNVLRPLPSGHTATGGAGRDEVGHHVTVTGDLTTHRSIATVTGDLTIHRSIVTVTGDLTIHRSIATVTGYLTVTGDLTKHRSITTVTGDGQVVFLTIYTLSTDIHRYTYTVIFMR